MSATPDPDLEAGDVADEADRRGAVAPNGRRKEDAIAARALLLAAVAILVSVIALVAALVISLGVLGTNDKVEQQRAGRNIALAVNCGALSAVIDAGRATITGGGILPPELEQFLERHGYPPKDVRDAQAKAAANAYGNRIADAVQRTSGLEGIVRADGGLNCKALAEYTAAAE